ncbi:MAG: hypothetical protein ABIR92_01525 [Gemmatimonadaceae bacterium]
MPVCVQNAGIPRALARKVGIMVSSWQAGRRAPRFIASAVAGVLIALPSVVSAQASGDGFMFTKPSGSLSIRGGYALANTSGQPFSVLKRETTIGARSFDAFSAGLDLNFVVARRIDLVFSGDLSTRTKSAEYREWEENGNPIIQQSTLERFALGAGLRYNLADRGRQISALAFIPARTIPYVGLSGGMLWYDFRQKGDFVESTDQQTASIFTDDLRSRNYNFMGQAYAGVDRRLTARWSLIGEARYTQASAKLIQDYGGLGNIQLSGLALNAGAAIRF